jgi:hypothetical protein
MVERKAARLRLAITFLIVLNIAALAYIVLAPETPSRAGARIEALQINAERIRVLGAASRGPGQGASPSKAEKSATAACLEWGPFAVSDTPKVEGALAQLGLAEPPAQRESNDASGAKRYTYLVREPNSAVISKIAELRGAFPGTEIRAAACPG